MTRRHGEIDGAVNCTLIMGKRPVVVWGHISKSVNAAPSSLLGPSDGGSATMGGGKVDDQDEVREEPLQGG